MATKEDQLVADIFALVTMMVEIVNPFAKALPLRLGTLRIKLVVCGVFPVYQPKVVLSLLMSAESVTAQDRGGSASYVVEPAWICLGIILKKVTCNRRVADLLAFCFRPCRHGV